MGGAETYLATLISAQRDSGDEVRLLASDSRGGGTLEDYPENLPYFESNPYIANGTSSSSQWRRAGLQLLNISAYRVAKKALAEFRPQVVHVHMYLGQLSPAVLRPFTEGRIPLIHTSHNYRIACPKGDRLLPDNSFCEHLAGAVCVKNCSALSYVHMRARELIHEKPQDLFQAVIAPGSTMKRILEMEGFARVNQIPNASTFTRREFVSTRCQTKDVLYVGRLVSNKGVDFLIKAFRKVQNQFPHARLHIAGDGPARDSLEKLAGETLAAGSCRFYGTVDAEAVRKLQGQSRIQCVPSVWHENSPIVVYEALTAGIPIVASNIGGIPDLVRQGKDGILVTPASDEALAEALIALCSDDNKCLELSQSAYRHADEFTMERHAKEIKAIYRQFVPE